MPGTSGTPGAVGKVRAVPCGYIQLFGLSFGSWDVFAQIVVLDFLFCKKSDLFKELPGKGETWGLPVSSFSLTSSAFDHSATAPPDI